MRPFTLTLATAILLYGCAHDSTDVAVRTVRPVMAAYTADRYDRTAPTSTTTTTPPPPAVEPPVVPTTVRIRRTPRVAPAPSGDALEAIARWFPNNYDSAVGVAKCESGLNPGAISPGGGNWGLFQINTVHRSSFEAVTGRPWDEAILNADANAQFAAWLQASSGWGPWACRWAA